MKESKQKKEKRGKNGKQRGKKMEERVTFLMVQ
jgi:hypothetical protein